MKIHICVLLLGLFVLNQAAWLQQRSSSESDEEEPPQFDDGAGIQKKMAAWLQRRSPSSSSEEEPPQFDDEIKKKSAETLQHEFFPCFHGGESVKIQLKTESLFAHEKVRAKHFGEGVNDLVWDNKLAVAAQAHSDEMAKKESMFHSPAGDYGENVAYNGISIKDNNDVVIGPAMMAYKWYNEIKNYNFETQSEIDPSKDIGHFTQMIWKDTTKVGCGLASVHSGTWHKTYYCCQYLPHGNIKGAYGSNVPLPIDGDTTGVPPQDLNVAGCCDYSTVCKKYKRYCNKFEPLKYICGITCKTCEKN